MTNTLTKDNLISSFKEYNIKYSIKLGIKSYSKNCFNYFDAFNRIFSEIFGNYFKEENRYLSFKNTLKGDGYIYCFYRKKIKDIESNKLINKTENTISKMARHPILILNVIKLLILKKKGNLNKNFVFSIIYF